MLNETFCKPLASEATVEEAAELAGLNIEDAKCILKLTRSPLSLDQSVGDHDDNFFGEFIEDHRNDDPLYDVNRQSLKDRIGQVLEQLNYREREILRLRYGLVDGLCLHPGRSWPDLFGHS